MGLNFKAELLKQEINIVQEKINHFDNLRSRMKQMAISLWLAAVGFGLSKDAVWIVALGAFVPLPFWYLEAVYHANQEGFIGRFWAIRTFVRDAEYKVPEKGVARFVEANGNPDFGAFPIPDYYGDETVPKIDRDNDVSIWKNFRKTKMLIIYLPLVAVALVASVSTFLKA